VIVEEGLVDAAFVAARTAGWPDFERFVRRFRPEEWESTTRVPAADVRRAARLYARARAPMQLHGLGVTEHLQGSEAVMLLCNLALLRGAVGREGVGVNPLRGQNNVQGAADMGCAPDRLPDHARTDDSVASARFAAAWGRALPTAAGRTLPKMYEAIDTGEIRAMYLFGEDVVQTDPDADRVRARLRKLDFLVVQELFLSETAQLADVVLPGAGFLEKEGTFTNGERRIQRVRRVLEPVGRARPDWRILLDLMAALGAPQRMESPLEIWDEVRRVAPPFAGASYEALDRVGLQWPVTDDAPQGTTVLHAPAFARGPAVFQQVEFIPSPALAGDAGDLLLVTGRVLDHYNSGSMTRRSKNVELAPADYLDLHPDDAAARAIAAGDRVRIASSHGEAHAVARLDGSVALGTVFLTFHFPATGTNRVTSDVVDRLSDCPEYKVTSVRVLKERPPDRRRTREGASERT